MSIYVTHPRDLFLSLIEGIDESPPWTSFMCNLIARTEARRAVLMIRLANAPTNQEPTIVHVSAPRAVTESALDYRKLSALGLHPYGTLRPGRVYALDEMFNYDDEAILANQREALEAMGVRFARWLRISTGGIADVWILMEREREDFSSSAVSTLSATATPFTAALRIFAVLNDQRIQTAMAQSALDRLGVGQIALDETGRVMAADPTALGYLTFVEPPVGAVGRRLQLPIDQQAALEGACAKLALVSSDKVAPMTIRINDEIWLLLKPWDRMLPEGCGAPVVIGTLRIDKRENERSGAELLRQVHGLSGNEASLAEKLSRGQNIIDSGRELRLTAETARNYSKRLYSKTGTDGQADLVREILTGLAPFA